MNKNNCFLTIGIPTYNRSHYLKECLDYLCPQITDEVKVVVRDNCSTNYNFYEFIQPYVEEYGVLAVQNTVNIGGDANVARLFECCDTKWLWVLGDDDYVSNEAVQTVVNIVKANGNSIYIKLNSKFEGETRGLVGFCNVMKEKGAYAASFFTSECINNIDATREYMHWHYRYLSTSTAQILRVIKFLQDHDDALCFFSNEDIILNHGADITWNHFAIVPYQSLTFDIFRSCRKQLNNNVFKAITTYCLVYIDSADIPWKDKLHYHFLFWYKFGIFNILHYNYVQILRIPLRFFIKGTWYKRIKQLFGRSN